MPINSSLYKKLIQRITELEKTYLPVFRPSGRYTKKEKDDIRAFSILVHAELESYFEMVGVNKVQSALKRWQANQNYNSRVLLSLSCYMEQSKNTVKQDSVELKLRNIVGQYINAVKKNNGIKEDNIKKLLLPIGVSEVDLNPTLLSTLSSFGSTRGSFAHSSAQVSVNPNPVDIKKSIHQILTDLKDLDMIIKPLK